MTGGARDQILARIRAANRAAAHPSADADAAYEALSRRYLRAHHDPAGHDIAALFAERAADYRAVVERVPEAGPPPSPRPSPASWPPAPPLPPARSRYQTGSPPNGWPNYPAGSRWPATNPRLLRPNSTR